MEEVISKVQLVVDKHVAQRNGTACCQGDGSKPPITQQSGCDFQAV